MVLRRVWGAKELALRGLSVSADGSYLTYIDWAGTNDVMVREVATGEVERLTYDGVDEPYETADDARQQVGRVDEDTQFVVHKLPR